MPRSPTLPDEPAADCTRERRRWIAHLAGQAVLAGRDSIMLIASGRYLALEDVTVAPGLRGTALAVPVPKCHARRQDTVVEVPVVAVERWMEAT